MEIGSPSFTSAETKSSTLSSLSSTVKSDLGQVISAIEATSLLSPRQFRIHYLPLPLLISEIQRGISEAQMLDDSSPLWKACILYYQLQLTATSSLLDSTGSGSQVSHRTLSHISLHFFFALLQQ